MPSGNRQPRLRNPFRHFYIFLLYGMLASFCKQIFRSVNEFKRRFYKSLLISLLNHRKTNYASFFCSVDAGGGCQSSKNKDCEAAARLASPKID
jgi:hypothetical protein